MLFYFACEASVTGLEESIPFCVIHSPGTCFWPGSAQGRRLMGFMRGTGRPICGKRDRIVGCVDNSHDGLARSIVPGEGTSLQGEPGVMVWTAPYGIECARMRLLQSQTREPSVNQIIRIGMDTSKHIFQLHGVDSAERPVLRRQLRRNQVLAFFAKLPPTVIGMEACGAAHYWARELRKLGHEVKLMAPQHVKAYVKRNKNDGRDAEGLCEAMSRPTMQFVPVKTDEQQAALMLAGVRQQLIARRTQLSNAIRGYAAEFGLTTAKGLDKIEPLLTRIALDETVPALARELLAIHGQDYARLQIELKAIEVKLMAWHRANACSRRLAQIPGVGPIGSSLQVTTTPDPRAFRSGRHFAAWLGLTPKDHSTAGKTRLGKITR